ARVATVAIGIALAIGWCFVVIESDGWYLAFSAAATPFWVLGLIGLLRRSAPLALTGLWVAGVLAPLIKLPVANLVALIALIALSGAIGGAWRRARASGAVASEA
ncbi:MAG: hypothetical protein LBM66_05200, partial [Bifidobacteriaceae bacterium]|nr:hypothetical protein [Bifidobacteriaceae bacterium]